jgi:hypothetical protein
VRRSVPALFVAALFAAGACASDTPETTIDDPEFVRRANALCARSVPDLRAPDRQATSTSVVTAERLDEVADGLAEVAADLRRVPVTDAAADEVDAWLDDWERFVEVGHRYAEAVEADDPERYSRIDDEAVELARRMGRFARGNGIDDCVL